MSAPLPEPLPLPWELNAQPSAKLGCETLADGRSKYWVDEVLPGITPKMLAWWFSHSQGEAWLKHAIEEMGNLENFLPQLYERETAQTTHG